MLHWYLDLDRLLLIPWSYGHPLPASLVLRRPTLMSTLVPSSVQSRSYWLHRNANRTMSLDSIRTRPQPRTVAFYLSIFCTRWEFTALKKEKKITLLTSPSHSCWPFPPLCLVLLYYHLFSCIDLYPYITCQRDSHIDASMVWDSFPSLPLTTQVYLA